MRGRDESESSYNRGNFLKLLKQLASYNKDVENVVLENSPKNSSYTSPEIQKEILHILEEKIKRAIHEEIGEEKFCVIIDEVEDRIDELENSHSNEINHLIEEEQLETGTGLNQTSNLQREGVDSIAVDVKEQKLTVIGEMDTVAIAKKLKKIGKVEIVTVGPAKEEKKDDKKDEKKDEKKDDKK
ncbi:uncharacterized protein LOC120173843 [Hibiscus syriacus]|uniref:uncharacterized protein LOC120173843 n=1 Tax=Hibiscus syriacus TaxID=106335 RepID=UPI00192139F1|nr:uncharacterized protein LOC120173843 [Hibiscus syriacus]